MTTWWISRSLRQARAICFKVQPIYINRNSDLNIIKGPIICSDVYKVPWTPFTLVTLYNTCTHLRTHTAVSNSSSSFYQVYPLSTAVSWLNQCLNCPTLQLTGTNLNNTCILLMQRKWTILQWLPQSPTSISATQVKGSCVCDECDSIILTGPHPAYVTVTVTHAEEIKGTCTVVSWFLYDAIFCSHFETKHAIVAAKQSRPGQRPQARAECGWQIVFTSQLPHVSKLAKEKPRDLRRYSSEYQ